MPHTPQLRRVRLDLETLEARTTPSSSAYVAGLYLNLLGRPAGPGEVAFWVGALNRGASPAQLTQGFTTSDEFRINLIRLDYATLLGRVPGPTEVNIWLRLMRTGLTDERFEAALLGSAEYFSRQGATNATWLAGVYRDVLGRPVDVAGANLWQQQLAFGVSRDGVAGQIVASSEAHGRVVTTVYRQLLSRDPDVVGRTFWVGRLDRGLTLPGFLAEVAASAEYINRTSEGGLDQPFRIAAATSEGRRVAAPLLSQGSLPRAIGPAGGTDGADGGGSLIPGPSTPTGGGFPSGNPFGNPFAFLPPATLPGGFTGLGTAGTDFVNFFSPLVTGVAPFSGFTPFAIPALGSNTFFAVVSGVIFPGGTGPFGLGSAGLSGFGPTGLGVTGTGATISVGI